MQKKITIHFNESWDPVKEEFVNEIAGELILMHSLISVSKWESKWKKSFFTNDKTPEEFLDYIKCMTINKNVSDHIYGLLSRENLEEIGEYINDPMTATTINRRNSRKGGSGEITTSELIYCWMTQLQIPFECEKWHLNRLMTLIEVCSIKNEDPKKMSKRDTMRNNAALNAARRAKHKSRG